MTTRGEWQEPYLDIRLSEEAMNYLWDIIKSQKTEEQTDARIGLVGNISKSYWIYDNKDNWLFKNVLKEPAEYLWFKEWNNYYDVIVTKMKPECVFSLKDIWVNYQKQHEFNPPHSHNRGYGFSFVVFMKIPTHWKEQHTLPWLQGVIEPVASNFQFLVGQEPGTVRPINIPLGPEDEGRMFFFPAWLHHQVFPFYNCEEERITVAGNIVVEEEEWKEKEKILAEMEQQVKELKESIKHVKSGTRYTFDKTTRSK